MSLSIIIGTTCDNIPKVELIMGFNCIVKNVGCAIKLIPCIEGKMYLDLKKKQYTKHALCIFMQAVLQCLIQEKVTHV